MIKTIRFAIAAIRERRASRLDLAADRLEQAEVLATDLVQTLHAAEAMLQSVPYSPSVAMSEAAWKAEIQRIADLLERVRAFDQIERTLDAQR